MSVEKENNNDISLSLAIVSLSFGVIGLCAWFVPICGGPLTGIGLVSGIVGMSMSNSTPRALSAIGAVLCGLGLLATILNFVLGLGLALMTLNY